MHIQETSSGIIYDHEKVETDIRGMGSTILWHSHFQIVPTVMTKEREGYIATEGCSKEKQIY
jgi:hypothetical protein